MKRILFFCAAMLAVLTCNAQQRTVQVMKDGQLIAEFYERDGWEFIISNGNGQGNDQGNDPQSPTDQHEAVDLDLPSGLKWASCNVGAEGSSQAGDYFAFGERDTYYQRTYASLSWKDGKEAGYSSESYFDCTALADGDFQYFTYTLSGKPVLDEQDDIARIKWGGDWRMPTVSEFQELIDNCNWTWENGGYKVSSKSDSEKFIFLPAAGIFEGTSISYIGEFGAYRATSLYDNEEDRTNVGGLSDALGITQEYYHVSSALNREGETPRGISRFLGCSVRPVCP